MRDGFVKIAAGTPNIRVADCMYNAEQIVALMKEGRGTSTGVYPQRDQRSGPDRRRRYAHPLPQ